MQYARSRSLAQRGMSEGMKQRLGDTKLMYGANLSWQAGQTVNYHVQ